jgi:hypothetical protein
MSAAELLMDLGRLGIRLEADGERLRYRPQSALTPDLLTRLKAHKGELLTMLRRASGFDVDSAPDAEPAPETENRTHRMPQELRRRVEATPDTWRNIDSTTTKTICRCGSTTWRDVPIQDGQSTRRDCGRCGRFLEFPIWHGIDTGHNDQYEV